MLATILKGDMARDMTFAIIETFANRIIEIVDENTFIDFTGTYQEYVEKYGK